MTTAVSRQWKSESRQRAIDAFSAQLLTIAQVITELGVPESTFHRWRHLGKGPRSFKLPNGAVRIRRSDFDQWMAALEETA